MTVAQELADYISRTGFDEIPDEVLRIAKICILDSIGNLIYGLSFPASQIASKILEGSSDWERGASVLGRGRKTSVPLAAFVNSVTAHVADYDDFIFSFRGHPSCMLMPAALASCESSGGSGKDLLTAFVVGSEIGGKVGGVVGRQLNDKGWHGTGIIGPLGCAAAAAKALQLDRNQTANALGIAASSAAGLRVNFGSMTKSYHAGHASMAGVLAAQLAGEGFKASPIALEGDDGFAKLFGCTGEISSVTESLGGNYALNGIVLKPFPSCGRTLPAVDATLKIRNRLSSNLSDIAEIGVRVSPSLPEGLAYHDPQTPLEAKFSMEYCLASALVFGRLGIEEFSELCLFHPEVRSLMKKVKMIPDLDIEKVARERSILAPARVEIRLQNGKKFSETKWEAKGGPSNPMTQDEIRAKFRGCAGHVLPMARVEKLLDTLEHLDSLKNVSQLTEELITKVG